MEFGLHSVLVGFRWLRPTSRSHDSRFSPNSLRWHLTRMAKGTYNKKYCTGGGGYEIQKGLDIKRRDTTLIKYQWPSKSEKRANNSWDCMIRRILQYTVPSPSCLSHFRFLLVSLFWAPENESKIGNMFFFQIFGFNTKKRTKNTSQPNLVLVSHSCCTVLSWNEKNELETYLNFWKTLIILDKKSN